MMMIIFILTASYIWDDVRIVYALAIYDAIFFGDGGTDKEILGVGYEFKRQQITKLNLILISLSQTPQCHYSKNVAQRNCQQIR